MNYTTEEAVLNQKRVKGWFKMLTLDLALHHVKLSLGTRSKPKFCNWMQGHNAENTRIHSKSILALCCIATSVNTQCNVRSSV